jgi:anti-sigma factor RsiW
MKPIDPAEISALLDGELPVDRAEEVRRAIAEDPAIRLAYDQLAAMDADLTACAAAAVFHPRVSIPAAPRLAELGVVPLAILMLVVRVAAKLVATGPGLAMQVAALAVVVGWILGRLIRVSQEDGGGMATSPWPCG